MGTLIIIVVIAFFLYVYLQNKASNTPYKLIDENEDRAYKNKTDLLKYINDQIAESLEMYRKHPKNIPPSSKKVLKEKQDLLTVGIPEFEREYIQLKERFKFDVKELLVVSIDYCDWYYNYKRFYDPVNFELWNEDSWDDRNEAVIKIREIEKRLKTKAK